MGRCLENAAPPHTRMADSVMVSAASLTEAFTPSTWVKVVSSGELTLLAELDAVDAVLAGEADVAAIGSSTWAAMGAAELMGESLTEVWRTDGYCHCMFTALDTLPAERYQPWLDRLLAMSWDDSEHRKILELEGLRRWVPPHLDGYKPLFEAVQEQGIDPRW